MEDGRRSSLLRYVDTWRNLFFLRMLGKLTLTPMSAKLGKYFYEPTVDSYDIFPPESLIYGGKGNS
jgi:hypothetical protein